MNFLNQPSETLSFVQNTNAQPTPTSLIGFEGPEKRFEVDFKYNPKRPLGLREIGREDNTRWQELLDYAKCTIIGTTKNEHFDSYVLSESSLFVYPNKIMIKTCGTTTLLKIIPKLLDYANELELEVDYVMYSRKNFLFPHVQLGPHSHWDKEVEMLNQYFDGSAFVMGPTTGDHWHLYLADYSSNSAGIAHDQELATSAPVPIHHHSMENHISFEDINTTSNNSNSSGNSMSSSPNGNHSSIPNSPLSSVGSSSNNSTNQMQVSGHRMGERTLEVMMHGLQRNAADRFYRSVTGAEERSKFPGVLGHLLPAAAVTDEFHFSPCGYSMNGLLEATYWTIHVTPEPHCSYASFETNQRLTHPADYQPLLRRLTDLFRPTTFTLAFSLELPSNAPAPTLPTLQVPGFSLTYKSHCDLPGHGIVLVCNYRSTAAQPLQPKYKALANFKAASLSSPALLTVPSSTSSSSSPSSPISGTSPAPSSPSSPRASFLQASPSSASSSDKEESDPDTY